MAATRPGPDEPRVPCTPVGAVPPGTRSYRNACSLFCIEPFQKKLGVSHNRGSPAPTARRPPSPTHQPTHRLPLCPPPPNSFPSLPPTPHPGLCPRKRGGRVRACAHTGCGVHAHTRGSAGPSVSRGSRNGVRVRARARAHERAKRRRRRGRWRARTRRPTEISVSDWGCETCVFARARVWRRPTAGAKRGAERAGAVPTPWLLSL